MKPLSILGSTGSIGVSTLEIVAAYPERFRVIALSAGKNLELLARQIRQFSPSIAAVACPEDVPRMRELCSGLEVKIVGGVEGLIAVATADETEMVVAAIVGAAGLVPTAAAIRAGKDIALANKETLVTAGHLFMDMVASHGVKLYPVDSEHSAIFQSLEGHRTKDISRIILTASGGPFLNTPIGQLADVTISDALNHPNWIMGKKISIDSATMMNKGLEIMEARWLFNVPLPCVDVVVHPESVVHSLVAFVDGGWLAQLSPPDMRFAIQYALTWPDRVVADMPALELSRLARLHFSAPDEKRFPSLRLARQAAASGGTCPAVLNAANEIAVEAFLAGKTNFSGIWQTVEQVLGRHERMEIGGLDDILAVDQWARGAAAQCCGA